MIDDEAAEMAEFAAARGYVEPSVLRVRDELPDGRTVSALQWRGSGPRLVLLHGGAQNAHTWDSVCLELDVPTLAVDLPGHGHSSWRTDMMYAPWTLADDIRPVLAARAPHADVLAGMSLGGLTGIMLATAFRSVRHLVLIDVTPGVVPGRTRNGGLYNGPESFASFDEMLAVTASVTGARPASLRRGVAHNARRRADGRWVWRHHIGNGGGRVIDYSRLWDDLRSVPCEVTLVIGGSSRVVNEEDRARFETVRPHARIIVVEGAGHSVQGSHPSEVAAILADAIDA
jgi:pimeloyl-ACP methyl ester carboxylesterase